MPPLELLSEISEIELIAGEFASRDVRRLRKVYGPGRWRKLKGVARVRLPDGTVCTAEIHWYEAHGIGKRDLKIKRIIEE